MSTNSNEIKLIIITFQDAFLWSIKHKKDEYEKAAAVISICKKDLQKLGITSGQSIMIKNSFGQITAKVKLDYSCCAGFGFMPKSSIINQLANFEDELPNFKWLEVIACQHSA